MDVKGNAIQWVRERPHQFFAHGTPEPVIALAYVMADVLVLGGGSCTIRRSEDWWVIASDQDWLAGTPFGPAELFQHLVPAPKHGVHSMRGELLLGAFATDVSIALGTDRELIQGAPPPETAWNAAHGLRRVIVFRMP